MPKPVIAVSRCLLGDRVRYDGTDKRCSELFNIDNSLFEVIPYCPEVSIGLPVPRLPMRLDKIDTQIFARQIEDNRIDYTQKLSDYAECFFSNNKNLAGLVTKKGSPSCGYKTSKLYENSVLVNENASGIFIARLLELNPQLAVIDEVDFIDEISRFSFFNKLIKKP